MGRTKLTPIQLNGEWFEELGRATLGSAGDTLTVTLSTSRKYLKIFIDARPTGSVDMMMRFNGDAGTNYAVRWVANGTPGSGGSLNQVYLNPGAANSYGTGEVFVTNVASKPKVGWSSYQTEGVSGAANIPGWQDEVFKWHNTSNQITSVTVFNNNGGNLLAAGSEVVVLGHD